MNAGWVQIIGFSQTDTNRIVAGGGSSSVYTEAGATRLSELVDCNVAEKDLLVVVTP